MRERGSNDVARSNLAFVHPIEAHGMARNSLHAEFEALRADIREAMRDQTTLIIRLMAFTMLSSVTVSSLILRWA
jgi:hypothetical protein